MARQSRGGESSVGVSFPCGPHRSNTIIWAEGRGIRVISEKEARKGPVSEGSKLLRPLFSRIPFVPPTWIVASRSLERNAGREQTILSHLVLEGKARRPKGAGII